MAEIKAIIKGENQITSAVKSAEKDLTGFQNSVKKTGDALQNAFAVTAVVAGLVKLGQSAKQCIDEFTEAEKVSLRLQKVWENVGASTGKSYRQIMTYADAIEKTTYFTGEAAEESALLLAATESLNEDGFERALNLSADLAAALGEDMTAAASTLAKAMEDPSSALTRLKTIGVTFTEEEKNQIKALTEANQTYEAQEIILNKIESKYKDVAKAINDTPSGTLDNIKDTLGDIRENLGKGLLDAISPALETLYGWLVKISQWVSDAVNANSISQRLKQGESLSAFSTIELEKALKLYQDLIANPVNNEVKAHLDYYERWVATLQDELKARADAAKTVMPTFVNGGDNKVSSTTSSSGAATLASFLDSYGKTSTSYIESSYQAIITAAQGMLDKITLTVPTTKAEMRELLGLDENASGADIKNAIEEGNYIQVLTEIISTYSEKLNALNVIPEILDSPTLTDLGSILDTYGKNSASYQKEKLKEEYNRIAAVFEYASDEEKVYLREILAENEAQRAALEEIPEVFEGSFLDAFSNLLSEGLGKIFKNSSNTQLGSAAGALLDTAVSSLGDAGEVAGKLAQNMMAMGPVLGAIVTALQYVIEGFGEVMGPVLNDFVKFGIEPLREFGRVIADILMPIMEDIMPSVEQSAKFLIGIFDMLGAVLKPIISFLSSFLTPVLSAIVAILQILEGPLKIVAKGLSAVGETLGWLGDWIRHIVAVVVNWLASWIPWMSGMEDVNPGNLGDRIKTSWTTIDNAFEGTSDTSSATGTSVKNASYSGVTSVTINIYQEAPVVGEGGMLQFAQMIRDSFEQLDYYSVSA